MTRFSKIIALLFVSISLIGIIWYISSIVSSKNTLPVLGEPGHVTGDFSFVNHQGRKFTQDDIKDKVVVVEYFFTTCPGICRIMNKNLKTVYTSFKNDPQFTILSHTVDPETDSVPTLANYAKLMDATEPGWEFLTGDKTALYTAAKKDYLLSAEENHDTSIEDEFIHTEYVALVDRNKRIRGFYDATDSLKMIKLVGDIHKLLKE